jgi:hypothetical protein
MNTIIFGIFIFLLLAFGIFFIISLLLKRSLKEMLKDIFEALMNVFS